jgi:hypothetical protein
MSAYGICYKCKTITPVVSRFHDGGVVLFKVGNGWVKDVWTTRNSGFVNDVVYFFQKRWQQIFPPLIAVAVVVGWVLERRG